MRKSSQTRVRRKAAIGWLVFPVAIALLALTAAGVSVAYAAHVENNDAFCASCHTEPKSQYFTQSLASPVDLASAHGAKRVECIQCHSGRGSIGRLTAMTTVAFPDLLAYNSGHYRSPAVTTVPLGDDHCLKCHADVTRRADFNNHFHQFLPLWQAQDPAHAATCVSCHNGHVAGGDPKIGFLVKSTAATVCQDCHAFAG